MPRRSGNSNNDFWTWIIIAIVTIIVFALVKKFIEENPWVRWFIFAGFTALFVFCVRYIVQCIRSRMLNIQGLCALVGAVFSILIVSAQTDFFRGWWHQGAWLVWVFNSAIIIWLLYLAIQLILEWWRTRYSS